MDKHREELLKKYFGEENYDSLANMVSEFQEHLEVRMGDIYLQKINNLINPKQAGKLVNALFQELEEFFTSKLPECISRLDADLPSLDMEKITHEFCDPLYPYLNCIFYNTYMKKFRNK
ncbi:hypothetical protein KBB69_01340 [Candidatus Dojkabacteria bacterium]|nr:hypothetical protein [Candidatus Dojkabacteria bacterium]